MRHHGRHSSTEPLPVHGLQLVQVLHPRTPDRWTERDVLEADDLDLLFFSRLRRRGPSASTATVTCEWWDHPDQRHKAIRESCDGGLNTAVAEFVDAGFDEVHVLQIGPHQQAMVEFYAEEVLPLLR